MLFNFLLQSSKQIRVEELVDCNTQTITQLFDRRHSRTIVPATDDVVYGGLCNTTNAAEFVNGNIAFLTQLDNSLPDSFAYGHRYHLFLSKMIPLCT